MFRNWPLESRIVKRPNEVRVPPGRFFDLSLHQADFTPKCKNRLGHYQMPADDRLPSFTATSNYRSQYVNHFDNALCTTCECKD